MKIKNWCNVAVLIAYAFIYLGLAQFLGWPPF